MNTKIKVDNFKQTEATKIPLKKAPEKIVLKETKEKGTTVGVGSPSRSMLLKKKITVVA